MLWNPSANILSPTCEGEWVKVIMCVCACVCVLGNVCECKPIRTNCVPPCKTYCICPWMMDADFVLVACCCYSGRASVCSMLMSLYSQAWVYFLWIDRDTSSWTFIAPLSDVYLRELTPVTRLYGLPPASHPHCLFFLRFAFSYHCFSHVYTWAEWQWRNKNEEDCEISGCAYRNIGGKKISALNLNLWYSMYSNAPSLSHADN